MYARSSDASKTWFSSSKSNSAREEIATWRSYDYLVVNRDVDDAVNQLTAIIVAERTRTSRLGLTLPDLELPSKEAHD